MCLSRDSCLWCSDLFIFKSFVLHDIQVMTLPKHQQRFSPLGITAAIFLFGIAFLLMSSRYEMLNSYSSQDVFQAPDLIPHPVVPSHVVLPHTRALPYISTEPHSGTYEQLNEIARLEGFYDSLTIKRLTTLLRQGGDTAVRQRAVEMLARIGDSTAVDMIVEGLADNHERVREAALHALLITHYNDIDLILGQVLHGDRSTRMRLLAVELLGSRHSPLAETFLTTASRDQHPAVRERAVQVLNIH